MANKKTKLMDRIFSAIENDEKEIQYQLNNDIDMALEDGYVDSEEYCINKIDDNTVEIHDKVNDEVTIAKVGDDKVEMTAKECDTKTYSDEPWYIVNAKGKTEFCGTAAECRKEWMEKGYKVPDHLITPVTMEERKPCKTFSEGKRCSDTEPTPNQEGADYDLKKWIEEHPGQAKYIAELGAKWGVDKILEGLEHDMNEGK